MRVSWPIRLNQCFDTTRNTLEEKGSDVLIVNELTALKVGGIKVKLPVPFGYRPKVTSGNCWVKVISSSTVEVPSERIRLSPDALSLKLAWKGPCRSSLSSQTIRKPCAGMLTLGGKAHLLRFAGSSDR